MLNALVRAFGGQRLGVSSIGLDGEELDAVSFLPKPRVFLQEGSLLATAEQCLARCEAGLVVLGGTGQATGLGEVLLARVTRAGNCLIGGASTAQGTRAVQAALKRQGAERLLIDGAFSRQSHALTASALIYVVGAHAAPRMEKVVEGAGLALRRMGLPPAGPEFGFLRAVRRPGCLDKEGAFHPLMPGSALGSAAELLSQVPRDTKWLYLPGALDGVFVEQLVRRRGELSCGLIVRSPLSLVMADKPLSHLFRLGRELRVLTPLRLAFVALNPVSPAGHRFDPAAFRQAMRAVTGLPLINVLEDVP